MRWEDERYVRVYTRDTGDWLALSFEAQALFLLLLRKVDRIGELRLGRRGRSTVAALVGHPGNAELLDGALAELLEDGCVRLNDTGDVLFIPNFLRAQETAKSPTERKREQRERDAARALEESRPVTSGHELSRDVTESRDGHEKSPRAVLYRAVPSVPGGSDPGHAPPASGPVNANDTLRDHVEALWEQKRGVRPQNLPDVDLRRAFEKAGSDEAVLLRVLAAALDRAEFPRLTKFKDLLPNWDAYAATKGPEPARKASPHARATDADKVHAGYSPPATADGEMDLAKVMGL